MEFPTLSIESIRLHFKGCLVVIVIFCQITIEHSHGGNNKFAIYAGDCDVTV